MLNIQKCRFCGMPFNSMGGLICPDCLYNIDQDFIKVREYIYDNPTKTNVHDIAEGTGVREKVILYLIEEGRLSTGGLEISGLTCQVCGRGISSGKICEDCARKLSSELDSVLPQATTTTKEDRDDSPSGSRKRGAKMHIDHSKD